MKNSTYILTALVVLILLVAGGAYAIIHMQDLKPQGMATTTPLAEVSTSHYSCAQGKIDAVFASSSVMLVLPDGTMLTLPQAISGSGFRYESGTNVFAGKGSDATLTQNGLVAYGNCLAGTNTDTNSSTGMKTFTDTGKNFSFSYPEAFSVTGSNAGYTMDWSSGSTKLGLILAQIQIPKSLQPNTNFDDAKFSVGTSVDATAIKNCLTANSGSPVKTESATINGTVFTKLTYGDAAAGNRYDTTSYRTVRNNQCYAIEYTIHYGNIQNYSPDSGITEFNEAKVQGTLDSVARSFSLL
jgi:membrane-bound inhibitor of C-type lysozyme